MHNISLLKCSCLVSLQECYSDETWAQVSVGVLTVVPEDVQLLPNQLHLDSVSTAIIVEGGIVMNDLPNLPEALCLLFGLSYVLHLDYPKAIKHFRVHSKSDVWLGREQTPTETSKS